MNQRDDFGPRGVLDLVADKWSILVIYHLHRKTLRHTQLKRVLTGVSARMLTVTLRKLEENGIVERKVYPIVPPKVEYSLTALGETLVQPFKLLCEWADVHLDDVRAARARFRDENDPQTV